VADARTSGRNPDRTSPSEDKRGAALAALLPPPCAARRPPPFVAKGQSWLFIGYPPILGEYPIFEPPCHSAVNRQSPHFQKKNALSALSSTGYPFVHYGSINPSILSDITPKWVDIQTRIITCSAQK
jgi:hypothetical protein